MHQLCHFLCGNRLRGTAGVSLTGRVRGLGLVQRLEPAKSPARRGRLSLPGRYLSAQEGLGMFVRDIMATQVSCCEPEATLEFVANLKTPLNEQGCDVNAVGEVLDSDGKFSGQSLTKGQTDPMIWGVDC